ncbi:hypothetical protein CONLIGDRAFT_679660 [Coniochaeta ligniaria NRRL 30616]|uniref:Uncharacterized protein n=1 Tax=Coniochaeta ligniaria NRRL 30616 TaxID=1408157 RepID=A0A1J7JT21_9PEZI|nr:hypothetical protein CONLIGDRAFT_679660 [Coniochaeta ligniaria NRRL 30616]
MSLSVALGHQEASASSLKDDVVQNPAGLLVREIGPKRRGNADPTAAAVKKFDEDIYQTQGVYDSEAKQWEFAYQQYKQRTMTDPLSKTSAAIIASGSVLARDAPNIASGSVLARDDVDLATADVLNRIEYKIDRMETTLARIEQRDWLLKVKVEVCTIIAVTRTQRHAVGTHVESVIKIDVVEDQNTFFNRIQTPMTNANDDDEGKEKTHRQQSQGFALV